MRVKNREELAQFEGKQVSATARIERYSRGTGKTYATVMALLKDIVIADITIDHAWVVADVFIEQHIPVESRVSFMAHVTSYNRGWTLQFIMNVSVE